MTASTVTVGYPVHRVTEFTKFVSEHGLHITDWKAACGASGRRVGQLGVFGRAGTALKAELCTGCFPGRDLHPVFPDPVWVGNSSTPAS